MMLCRRDTLGDNPKLLLARVLLPDQPLILTAASFIPGFTSMIYLVY